MCTVSVAIPAYKRVFLSRAIDSVLAQTYQDFELVIVNDASPFGVGDVVRRYDDPRIAYFENDHNIGKDSVVQNWNRCLEYARGPYFILFSDDDLYEPSFLQTMVDLAAKYPNAGLFSSRVKIINEVGDTVRYSPLAPEFESGLSFIWHRANQYRVAYTLNFMCRTEQLKQRGGFVDFPLAWGSDDATWFSLALKGGVASTHRTLAYWRQSSSNISSIGDVANRLEAIEQQRKWMKVFLSDLTADTSEEAFYLRDLQSAFDRKLQDNIVSLLRVDTSASILSKLMSFAKLFLYSRRFHWDSTTLIKGALYKLHSWVFTK